MVPDPRREQRSGQAADGMPRPSPQQPAPPTAPSQQSGTQPNRSQSQGGGQARGTEQQQNNPLVPSLALPKAGGAIQGLGEKFAANLLTGVPSVTVPIFTSPGRSGFGPQLALSYQPGSGNGPFGLEWALSVPAISRKTEKGLPRYDDADDSDTFILSSAEDLVPALYRDSSGNWQHDTTTIGPYNVRRYRPRVEGLFARIERLQHRMTGDVFWRAITKDNVTSIYGQSKAPVKTAYGQCARRCIADPADSSRIFKWLLEATYDDKGNLAVYEYKAENVANVDPSAASEVQRRTGSASFDNCCLKYIHYGNTTPYAPDPTLVIPASAYAGDWLFHVAFDYGEHAQDDPALQDVHQDAWLARQDPFSTYRAGFEIRTYRLCQRVLMFHTIPELDSQPYLVRSTHFTYAPSPLLTQLVSVTSTGYVKDPQTGTYQSLSFPSLDFTYTQATADPTIHTVDADSVENLPIGLDGTRYQWIDLDSEGLSGVLTEQAGTWFYKRNLGQGQLAPVKVVATLPSLANLAGGRQQILDLASNGHKSLVELSRPISGYYARTWEAGNQDAQWDTFIPFASCPVIDWQDPNLRMIDVDGDGRADVLISEDELFTWYPSLAEEGFGPAEWVRKPFDDIQGPALVFADGTQSIYLADMSGDGLTDLVRIRNGEVSYWPNLGYGRFGPRVVMDAPPVFDYLDQFEQRRVKLADIDGSGTTDIVYIGRDVIRYWLNQSGNTWSAAQTLQQFPAIDDLANVSVVDLLGTGTSCIVWSSPLPRDVRHPMQYIDLMSATDFDGTQVQGCKPYLLNSVINNLGAETRLKYLPSTAFYLVDAATGTPWSTSTPFLVQLAGRVPHTPWSTRVPFPVQVVVQVESRDAVSGSKIVTHYAYHHGYYDADEREFRGFGCVEQWDTQSFADYVGAGLFDTSSTGVEADLHLPPVHTKTWYHTGIYKDRENIAQHYAGEYYAGDPLATLLPDSELPTGLSAREERECCRALKGMVLRSEVYGTVLGPDGKTYVDDGPVTPTGDPYSASEHNYAMRLVQPVGENRYAVVYAYGRESLDYHYERNPTDPRIGHQVTLEVDDYGHVTKSAAIGYPRRSPVYPEQGQPPIPLITCMESDVINVTDQPNFYRLGVPAEMRTYELTGALPATARFTLDQLKTAIFGRPKTLTTPAIPPATEIAYEQAPDLTRTQKRLLKKARTLYYEDDLTGPLPLGMVGAHALPYGQYQLAFTAALLQRVFTNPLGTLPTQAQLTSMLGSEGAYLHGSTLFGDADDVWWTQSGRQVFDATRFYLPVQTADPFGNTTAITYDDPHYLLVTKVTDPLNNMVVATNDYRLLRPSQITDPNGNQSGAQSDALGMVVASWETGKNGEGSTQGDPSRKLDYDLFAWKNSASTPTPQPVYVHTTERETYGAGARWLDTYTYSDGFGRVIQAKVQAEPGPAPARDTTSGVLLAGQTLQANPRWVGTGRTIYDNKGNPVKQYEPFFSADSSYETEVQLVQIGVTPVLRYDPLSRLIRTDLPDGSNSKIEFDPWQQQTWDPNDSLHVTDPVTGAVTYSRWYNDKNTLAPNDPEYQALKASLPHADTPTTVHLDTLGRAFLSIADNGLDANGMRQLYPTRVTLDIEGNQLAVTDARGNTVLTADYDQLGRALHTLSPDAGERWMLADVTGKPIRGWDSRGYAVQTTYDALRRPLDLYVTPSGGTAWLAEHTVYGDTQGVPYPTANNLLGQVYQQYDAAGVVTNVSYDFKGNLLRSIRQLLRDVLVDVDWSKPQTPGDAFSASTTYDALNRPTSSTAPDGSVVFPTYNEARLLERVDVQLAGTGGPAPYVTDIDYDAMGQRTLIAYGNGVRTNYAYDPYTFRLTRLTTTRPSGSDPLQDLQYAYDPVGNITSIQDGAQETVYVNNSAVKPTSTYVYDAIYRLLQAVGREHISLYGPGSIPSALYDPADALRCNLTNPSDLQAMQTYTESYSYDSVGNITLVQHQAGSGGWNRSYAYAHGGNRLLSTSLPGDPPGGPYSGTYAYDPHGNMISMPHLPQMAWDFKNELQQVDLGGGGTASYIYDSSEQRVRKVWVHSGVTEERLYLGGYERYRKTSGSGAPQVERRSLHIMDGVRRICLVETTTVDTSQTASALPAKATRYQLGNHLGSAVLELDKNAAIISYEEYYPYGSTSYQAGRSVAETGLKRYRFTGKERDEETGLYYHGVRYYAPWLGRWTSCDPAGLMDGPDLYQYASSNPTRLFDPTGTQGSEGQSHSHGGGLVITFPFEIFRAKPPTPPPPPPSASAGSQTAGGTTAVPQQPASAPTRPESGPPPSPVEVEEGTSWKESTPVQGAGGFVAGLLIGSVPFGGVVEKVLSAVGLVKKGTPAAESGKAVGELVAGAVATLLGLGGKGTGGGYSTSGSGAIAIFAVYRLVVVGSVGNMAAGIHGATQALATGSGKAPGAPPAEPTAPAAEPGAPPAEPTAPAAKVRPTSKQIYSRGAEIADSPEFLAQMPKRLPRFLRDVAALARATKEAVGGSGQVWRIGEFQGSPVYGTIRNWTGIVEINGETMIVRIHPADAPRIIGPFRP
jgi:RHS repeat-associated protein